MKFVSHRGFTLIELLVVIAIIGLLSAVILATLGSARAKARDARRYADLESVALALELYYDARGSYPSTGGVWRVACPYPTGGVLPSAWYGYTRSGSTGYIPDLAPTYIPILPIDPGGQCIAPPTESYFGGYDYISDGVDYLFAADWTGETGSLCTAGLKYADPVAYRQVPDGHGRYFCSIRNKYHSGW